MKLKGFQARAAQAFQSVKSKASTASITVGAAVVSSNTWAVDDTAVQAALDANKGSTEVIVAGIFAIALVITGLGIMLKLLNR